MLLVALLYLICASTFTISKAALAVSEPIFYTGVRMLAAGVLFLFYYWWQRGSFKIKREHYPLFLGGVGVYIFGSYVADNVALKYVCTAKACFFYNLSPFITALFSYWIFRERMTFKKWLGMGIGFLGFVPMLIQQECLPSTVRGWPELLLLIAVVCSVYGWIIVRQLVKTHGYSPALVNGISMTGGGALALVTSWFLETWQPIPVTDGKQFLIYTLMIMVVSNLIFSTMYTNLLKVYTATFLSFAGFTAPMFAGVLGWFFLGERPAWDILPSTILVLFGLYIFYKEELKQGYLAA